MKNPGSEAGMTLVELMVVVAIIGLAASAALLTLVPAAPGLADDAALFARQMSLARRESILRGAPVTVTIGAEGFRITLPQSGETLSRHAWSAVQEVRLEPEGPVSLDPAGLGSAFTLMLGDGRTWLRLESGPDGQPKKGDGHG
ncbi:MAG: hypothetical protein Kow00104_10600 [Rhodothalassiaceae bacterium]